MSGELSHLDAKGQAHMVDVGAKSVTQRVCVARGAVRMAAETLAKISEGRVPKGDVFATARLAGIQAAKRTFEWIPLCHPLSLDSLEIELRPDPTASRVWIEAQASAHAKTGSARPWRVPHTPRRCLGVSMSATRDCDTRS
jgi:cyclic pyranopterin phosphate synthase